MESLQSLGDKYVYDIVGHSGDSECIPFVLPKQPPKDEMERLKVLQSMSAHSQCKRTIALLDLLALYLPISCDI